MKARVVMHIDMNSYFASVEQQANPFWRGRPLGVCAYLSPGGCIIASSREAKALGVKTGCRVRDALALAPDIVLVENDPAKYRFVTAAVFDILREYSDRVEPYSIDEAFLDLSGWVPDLAAGAELAELVQARIRAELGDWLYSSAGIGWTKFLAKFASDIAPKGGRLLIDSQVKLAELLKGRELTEAWGINTGLEARLRALGIKDLLDLREFDHRRLLKACGRWGYYLWAHVNGLEVSAVEAGTKPPKSIGHSYCLPQASRDREYLERVLYKLCEKAGRRLRQSGSEAGHISLSLAWSSGGAQTRCAKTDDALFTTEEIFACAGRQLDFFAPLSPVRSLAVSVGRLSPVSPQLSLFENKKSAQDLSRALDRLNDKYGEYTVVRGRILGADKIAPDRIGFRKIA